MATFTAKLEAEGPGSAYTILRVPPKIASQFGDKHRIRVSGTLNGVAFAATLFRHPKGGYLMMVNKAMKKQLGAENGDSVQVTMELG